VAEYFSLLYSSLVRSSSRPTN